MTFDELVEAAHQYYPALYLSDIVAPRTLRRIRRFAGYAAALFLVAAIVAFAANPLGLQSKAPLFEGLGFIALAVWLVSALLTAFYNSYYFLDVAEVVPEPGITGKTMPVSFAVAEVLYHTDRRDAPAGFMRSPIGRQILVRLGIDISEIDRFFSSRNTAGAPAPLSWKDAKSVDLEEYAVALIAADKEFAQFLFARAIQEKDFLGCVAWVAGMERERKARQRWWGRDALLKVPPIGSAWSFGQVFELKRFAFEVEGVSEDPDMAASIVRLEVTLARAHGASALVIADTGTGEMNAVRGLAEHIRQGTSPLAGKQVYALQTMALIAAFPEKVAFERACTVLFNQAAGAGNVILVFEDLPGYLEAARRIGSDAFALLAPYLTGSNLQVIAIADRTYFHEHLEGNAALLADFELVRIAGKTGAALIAYFEREAQSLEAQSNVVFTYPAIVAVAEAAQRFFSESTPEDKGRDLLSELSVGAGRTGQGIVTVGQVRALVEQKSGVPQEGVLGAEERTKLLSLESTLHERIVGQDEAVRAIVAAITRARTGLSNRDRPIGSFLFLGPTGVGKTETAKALAEVFFGAGAPMLRLDMSEYAGVDALPKLTGSFETGHPGVLAEMLRDRQYGVLLLDEFEKASREVHNVFLQVLDEGFFSDMHGGKVNARNTIIIATSNAGAAAIAELVETGKNLAEEKGSFIDALIGDGVFSPELLNRFDGVILFHPLTPDDLLQIARLLAEKLAARLKEQGFDLTITDDLVSYMAREGYDPKFGAREMNRVLAENIEPLITHALLEGSIQKGATIEFVASANGLQLRTR